MRIEPADGVMEVGQVHFSPLLSRTPMDSECPVVDRALQNWLAIDNFHADGSQKRNLESFRQTPEQ